MRLLLDTKILLWALMDYSSLGVGTRLAIKGAQAIYVSAATMAELIEKREAGLVTLPDGFDEAISASGFVPLPVDWAAALAIADVEHGNMIDRLLIAQAREHQLMLVTADEVLLKEYPSLCMNGKE